MDFYKYPISQSLIKKFLHKGDELDFCPRQIYHTEWVRDVPRYMTDEMLAGRYAETKFLGGTGRGDDVHDLPRKRLTKLQIAQNEKAVREGKEPPNIPAKKISQIRIDDQALIFKQLCVKYQVTIMPEINTQIPILIIWAEDPNVVLEMVLDVFPTSIVGTKGSYYVIIDLKLTANIHNTFGKYCYGDPAHLDKTQGWMYHYGVRNIDLKVNPHMEGLITPKIHQAIKNDEIKFLLWVFDYKKEELENKFIEIEYNDMARNELFESIRKTVSIIEINENLGWPARPEYSFCSKCPVKDCPDRTVVETI